MTRTFSYNIQILRLSNHRIWISRNNYYFVLNNFLSTRKCYCSLYKFSFLFEGEFLVSTECALVVNLHCRIVLRNFGKMLTNKIYIKLNNKL